jgi:two-component system LytT family sensor kinase
MMLLVFGTGAAIGLQSGLIYLLVSRSAGALFVFVGMSLVYAGITYVLWRWIFPLVRTLSVALELLAHTLIATTVFTLFALTFTQLVVTHFGPPPTLALSRVAEVPPHTHYLIGRLIGVVPTVLITLIGYHESWKRIVTLESRERELTELAATAQLAALRSQMSPHFLFNSLNSIAQLIHVDPEQAEVCVQKLAAIFRYILRRAHQEFVPFVEELELAEAYLEIERARFGERLLVETTIDPRSLRHPIPTLILQPLVENAVKHGLSAKIGPGTVRIDARIEGSVLRLTVVDDGRGMAAQALAEVWDRGVGLRNLRARLQRLYGPAHLPEITSTPGAGTRVSLRLPAEAA